MSTGSGLTLEALKGLGIKGLAKKAGKDVAKVGRTTVAERKAQLAQKLEAFDVDALLELQERLAHFVDLVTLSLGDDVVLADSAKFTLIKQALASRDIGEFISVVDSKIKEIAFAHMDALLEADGVEDPAAHNAEISVSAAGYALKREGAGYTDPTINEGLLAQILGDEGVERFFETETVTKTVRTLSLDKLFAAIEEDPKLMIAVQESLEPGKMKNARLVRRSL